MTIDIVRSYDRIAGAWDRDRRRRGLDPCIRELAGSVPAGGRILDVGCGTGYPVAAFLDGCGFRVTGIDPSEAMLEKAKDLGLAHTVLFRTGFLEFRTDERYDAIIALDSLFHIPCGQQADIYPQAAGLLKPGGLFLFTHGCTDGSVTGTMFGEPFAYSALGEGRLKECLREAGLEIVRFQKEYRDPVTGTRDLLALVRKGGGRPVL